MEASVSPEMPKVNYAYMKKTVFSDYYKQNRGPIRDRSSVHRRLLLNLAVPRSRISYRRSFQPFGCPEAFFFPGESGE